MESDNKKKISGININGVLNIIRLEGVIGKIKKVYYLYIVIDYPVHIQLECDDMFSVDIEKHFADMIIGLQNNKKMYDFYIENIDSFQTTAETIDRKESYNAEIKKFFIKILNDHHGNFSLSTAFKNIRCHYVDIKEYYLKNDIANYNSILSLLFDDINYYNYSIGTLNALVNSLSNLKNKLSNLFLEKSISNDKMFNKLNYEYHNLDVKNVGIKLINAFASMCKKCVIQIDNLIKLVVEFSAQFDNLQDNTILRLTENYGYSYCPDYLTINKYYNQILPFVMQIRNQLYDIESVLETAVLNRTFNDKDYSNIVIVASENVIPFFIEILIKDYNFVITNSSLSDDLETVNKNLKNVDISQYNKYLLPNILSQCSILNNFPDKFN